MRIIFVNRYLPPDQSATAQILDDVTQHLAEQDKDVVLIGSRLSYDNDGELYPKTETLGTRRYIRVATTRFGRSALIGRSFDYLSFYIAACIAVLRWSRKGDLVVAKSDPPILGLPIGLIARLKGARHANWLQDLYPEVAAELSVKLAKGWLGRGLTALRNWSLRNADANIVIGSRMADRLLKAGVSQSKIRIIPNWTDDETIHPIAPHKNPLRKAWGFSSNTLVVGYSGNLGRAHDVNTMLDAATRLKAVDDIQFLFIGGGKLRETLRHEIEVRGLQNIVLKPYQPRENLAQSLSVADVHWASLRPSLEGLIVPSKIYGIAAAGRPLIFIGDPDGEVSQLLQKHAFGMSFAPGDAEAIVTAVLDMSRNRHRGVTLGRNARAMIDGTQNKRSAMQAWGEVVSDFDGYAP